MADKNVKAADLIDDPETIDPVAPIDTTIPYVELGVPYNSIPHRCGYLMQNQMQCPTHVAIALAASIDEITDTTEFLCMYHFNLIALSSPQYKFVNKSAKNPEPAA